MIVDIRIPELGDGVTEATVVQWHKSPGDAVAVGEPVVDVMTDKMGIEIEAPADGVLVEVLHLPDEEVKADAVLGRIRTAGDAR